MITVYNLSLNKSIFFVIAGTLPINDKVGIEQRYWLLDCQGEARKLATVGKCVSIAPWVILGCLDTKA